MKTAVILAARKEQDSEQPYPILPFAEGRCLIDRSLSILRKTVTAVSSLWLDTDTSF